jgi:hypothetical protein
MYVDSSPVTARRSARQNGVRRHNPTPETTIVDSAASRRTRLADAIVSQWLLEQVPPEHRHALRSASDPRRELPV